MLRSGQSGSNNATWLRPKVALIRKIQLRGTNPTCESPADLSCVESMSECSKSSVLPKLAYACSMSNPCPKQIVSPYAGQNIRHCMLRSPGKPNVGRTPGRLRSDSPNTWPWSRRQLWRMWGSPLPRVASRCPEFGANAATSAPGFWASGRGHLESDTRATLCGPWVPERKLVRHNTQANLGHKELRRLCPNQRALRCNSPPKPHSGKYAKQVSVRKDVPPISLQSGVVQTLSYRCAT